MLTLKEKSGPHTGWLPTSLAAGMAVAIQVVLLTALRGKILRCAGPTAKRLSHPLLLGLQGFTAPVDRAAPWICSHLAVPHTLGSAVRTDP